MRGPWTKLLTRTATATTCCHPPWRAAPRGRATCPAQVRCCSGCRRVRRRISSLRVDASAAQEFVPIPIETQWHSWSHDCSASCCVCACRRQARPHHPHPPRLAVPHRPQLGRRHHGGPAALQVRHALLCLCCIGMYSLGSNTCCIWCSLQMQSCSPTQVPSFCLPLRHTFLRLLHTFLLLHLPLQCGREPGF